MIVNDKDSKTLKSDLKLLDIIECLQERNGARVSEVADELSLSKSTVHAHLSTLAKRGYVAKDGDEYKLGILFLNLGTTARRSIPHFETIRPGIDRLAQLTGERVQFVIEEHGLGYVVSRSYGEHAVHVEPQIGEPSTLHANASGKAILSALPAERVTDIIDYWGLPVHTDQTISDRETLLEELERIRERGYAVNSEESRSGFLAVGVPIHMNDTVLGAISISGPQNRMDERLDEDILDPLLGVVNEIELNIAE